MATSTRLRASVLTAALVILAAACGPTDTPRERIAAAGAGCTVDFVGDSFGVGATQFGKLGEQLAAVDCTLRRVDVVIGRHPTAGAAVVERWAAEGDMSSILVVALGTNGCRDETQMVSGMQRIHAAAGPDRPIVWVNVWNRDCDANANRVLNNMVIEAHYARADHGRMWVVDHWAWMATDPGRSPDGLHLTTAGYREYAVRIVSVIQNGSR